MKYDIDNELEKFFKIDSNPPKELWDAKDPWIQTYSGIRFTPTNPRYECILIQDIAHALSMQCRFIGHCKEFYSVAQHSVAVSYICNEEDALWGLLHDASEAYLVDIPKPLKDSGQFDAYLNFESKMMTAVCNRFGLKRKEPASIMRADKLMLATESREFMGKRCDWIYSDNPLPLHIKSMLPQDAKKAFLLRFIQLMGYHESVYDLLENRNWI